MALKIEDYAMIGDCKTAALVGRNGSIDWLCWPRFDSAACFAALLGECENGRWLIAPKEEPIEVSRHYRSGTLILETEFRTKTGSARLVDFMIPGDGADLVRIVIGRQGQVDFRAEFLVRLNYGATVPWVNRLDDGGISAIAGPERLVLRTTTALYGEDLKTVSEFTIEAGQSIPFVLSYGPSFQNPPPTIDAFDALERTEAFWRRWSDRCPEVGPWTEAVKRSLITLKALTYAPMGGIVAAPTTSLPELIAGVRNWDYRYCWLRDATFTLQALMYLGYYDEARAWRDWLIRAVAGSPEQVQIVYGLGGERWLPELTVPWLIGYEKSAPVRIGNAAYQQLQLDIYGEMMDSIYLANKYGDPISYARWQDVQRMLEWLGKNWQRPDEGIWEVRGGAREFLHSRLMCWVAFDRALRLAQKRSLSAPFDAWLQTRDAIREDIFTNFWDDDLGSFVQSKGTKDLDASVLLMPLMRFISPVDPMWRSTMKAIEARLVEDTLVHRYEAERTHVDGIPGGEGSFTACSFWYIECLARAGELEKAQLLFEKLLGYANHLGLYSEQIGPSGQHLGNFPQAFTHLALISTATYLDRVLSGKEDSVWR